MRWSICASQQFHPLPLHWRFFPRSLECWLSSRFWWFPGLGFGIYKRWRSSDFKLIQAVLFRSKLWFHSSYLCAASSSLVSRALALASSLQSSYNPWSRLLPTTDNWRRKSIYWSSDWFDNLHIHCNPLFCRCFVCFLVHRGTGRTFHCFQNKVYLGGLTSYINRSPSISGDSFHIQIEEKRTQPPSAIS